MIESACPLLFQPGIPASCGWCHIPSLPLALNSWNRDSSLHGTRFQSSALNSLHSLAKARCAARWRALSNDSLVGQRQPKLIR
ncbi:hypothetical protein TNCV_2428221 [Trichonephila clavipes]|nr:hypothetical protein TNCV_2428221 [Trichonephila clavipes]